MKPKLPKDVPACATTASRGRHPKSEDVDVIGFPLPDVLRTSCGEVMAHPPSKIDDSDIQDLGDVLEEVAEELYRGWPFWTRVRYRWSVLRLILAILRSRIIENLARAGR